MSEIYLCSITDAAKALGVGRTTTYQMIKNRDLETIQIGTRRLVKMESIKAFIERSEGGAA